MACEIQEMNVGERRGGRGGEKGMERSKFQEEQKAAKLLRQELLRKERNEREVKWP